MSHEVDRNDVIEALQEGASPRGREDEQAGVAAAWAGSQLVRLSAGGLVELWGLAAERGVDEADLLDWMRVALSGRDDAVGTWARITASLPEGAGLAVLYNLALVWLHELGEARPAVLLLEDCCQRWPEDADAWLVLGNARQAVGEVEGAIAAFAESARLAPSELGGWLNLGQLLEEQERWVEAVAAMRRCVAVDDAVEHLHVLGHVMLRAGDEAEGSEVLVRAEAGYSLRIRRAHRTRAWSRGAEGELAPLYYWRGAARCLRGELAGALRDLREAVARDPALLAEAEGEGDYAALRADTRRWGRLGQEGLGQEGLGQEGLVQDEQS